MGTQPDRVARQVTSGPFFGSGEAVFIAPFGAMLGACALQVFSDWQRGHSAAVCGRTSYRHVVRLGIGGGAFGVRGYFDARDRGRRRPVLGGDVLAKWGFRRWGTACLVGAGGGVLCCCCVAIPAGYLHRGSMRCMEPVDRAVCGGVAVRSHLHRSVGRMGCARTGQSWAACGHGSSPIGRLESVRCGV